MRYYRKEDEEPSKLSAIEMLSRINRFYDKGKLSESELQAAAENIARRADESEIEEYGTSFAELFGE